ncbi:MAG: DHHA1 domain-containing protein, partial [Eggerthellaceae bacterium]|nr:DHHA1 domain-containing protein [Eggerthellaceae bacterium]
RNGDTVTLTVDARRRSLIARNHSATHLLQKALQTVLGDHVQQKGSDVNEQRLRFDFTHFSAMTEEEIRRTEDLVNQEIQKALPVVTEVMSLEDAKKSGAMALFGEKYGESVRVVEMGDFSRELCGGTHVANTSSIAAFRIISESGVASGVRRIEALTSEALFAYYNDMEQKLKEAAQLLKTTPSEVAEKISHLQNEVKELHGELESLKSREAKAALGDVSGEIREIAGIRLIAKAVDGVDMNGLRELGDSLKEQLGEGVVLLASAVGGKVSLVAMATDGAVKAGAHAGNLIKAVAGMVGGGGGGRPNMAQAGGKNPAGIPEAVAAAEEILANQLKK